MTDEELGATVRRLMDEAEYKTVYNENETHPCPVIGCRISAEEHHRLAYGFLRANTELRRLA